MINETHSLDSTLESPSKPFQVKSSPQKRSIFLVHYSLNKSSINQINQTLDINKNGSDVISPKKISPKKSKHGGRAKKSAKKFEKTKNLLDFDSLLNAIFPAVKDENIFISLPKRKNFLKKEKKNLGRKKGRQAAEDSKSKKNFFNFIYR